MGGIIPAAAGSGLVVYGTFMDMQTGQVWNGAAMEVYNQAHWATYVVAGVEQAGSGRYIIAVPGGLPASNYWVIPYIQASGSPSVSNDTPIDLVRIGWDTFNIIDLNSGLNIAAINGSKTAAANLALSANTLVSGVAAAGTLSTAQMTTNLTSVIPNNFNGRTIYFTSGANAGVVALVTAYVVTGGRLTFVAFNNLPIPVAPTAGDTFVII